MKDQCWIAQAGTPASIDERSVDVAREPAAVETVELMMVGATRCEAPVRRQAMEGRVHATLTVSPALIIVDRQMAPVWRMMPPGWAGGGQRRVGP